MPEDSREPKPDVTAVSQHSDMPDPMTYTPSAIHPGYADAHDAPKKSRDGSIIALNVLAVAMILVYGFVAANAFIMSTNSGNGLYAYMGMIAALFSVLGIGLLARKAFARTFTVGFAVFGVVLELYMGVVAMLASGSLLTLFASPEVYVNIAVIVILNLPKVKKQFQ